MLIIAKGFEPAFASKVDPAAGILEVTLDRIKDAPLGPRMHVQGRIIDPQGRPVMGARVE
ncbi:MAG: hypothetical protein HY735_24750 [Verrucomicrobia bacterium]|nr:hypothetical protein [Verrucomicrobiota bacterium]